MCRWILYLGARDSEPLPLSDLLTRPVHSLVRQAISASYHPGFTSRNNAVLNADGFGVAWYCGAGAARAALYRSVQPAWADQNLRELSAAVASTTILAHVRAASPGSVISMENCHPFKVGRLAFMHNGHIEAFASQLRRALLATLHDEAFAGVQGLTDSEVFFALVVMRLREPRRAAAFAPGELAAAVEGAVGAVLAALADAGVSSGFTTLNIALTDGETVVCTRFCDRWPAVPPPSLYFALAPHDDLRADLEGSGAPPVTGPGDGSAAPKPAGAADLPACDAGAAAAADDDGALMRWHECWARDQHFLATAAGSAQPRALLVASEPATEGALMWRPLPANTMLVYSRGSPAPTLTRLLSSASKV